MLAECSRDAVIRIEKARADPNFNSEGMQPLEMGVEELSSVLGGWCQTRFLDQNGSYEE